MELQAQSVGRFQGEGRIECENKSHRVVVPPPSPPPKKWKYWVGSNCGHSGGLSSAELALVKGQQASYVPYSIGSASY